MRSVRSAGRGYSPRVIVRERLLAVLRERPVGLVEAGAGYGKSVLAAQHRQALGIASAYVPLGPADQDPAVLISSIRRGLRAARLSDLLAATDVADPRTWIERLLDALSESQEGVLLVLDDAHHLLGSEPAAELVLRLARVIARPHHLLVAARSLTAALEPVWSLPEAARLDTQALAFTAPETAELLRVGSRGSVEELDLRMTLEATGGWATALVLAAATRDLAPGVDPVGSPLRGMLGAMTRSERAVAVQIGHLPLLSPALCDEIAGREGCFDALVAHGIPLARTDSGWWELPSPVAARLAAQAPATASTIRCAADAYARGGEVLLALRSLLGAGLADAAAARIAALDAVQLDDLGFGVVQDLVETLPEPALRAQPRVLLHLARLAETAHQSEHRARALRRAGSLLGDGADVELARELDAERARDLMWDERDRERSAALAARVIEHAGPGELTARARALDVLGRLKSWFSPTGPQPEAETLLLDSARLARAIGQRTWAAQALAALGHGFYFALCRFEQELTILDEVLGELPARHRYRAMIQTFHAEVLGELGRSAEAEAAIAEIRAIGESCRERWVLAYAAWQEAQIASYAGDRERCARAVHAALHEHRDAWFEQPSGVEFLAQAADHLSRVGEDDQALELLGMARARMAETEHLVRVHGAAVLARSGDPAEAEAAIALALGPTAEPGERWPLMLLRAHAALRRGDPRAGYLAAVAFEHCAELGHPAGPLIREPAITAALIEPACATASPAALALARGPDRERWAIRTLGDFAVTRDGVDVELPAGRPTRAIRILAAHGGRMAVDALIEALWPDIGPVTGRNRLRNLLSRIRTAAGDLVRREEDWIGLAPTCEVDAERFERQAQAALASFAGGERGRGVALARTALELCRGEFLPNDRYVEWATAPRERVRLRQLDLLDLLAASAEERDEVDEAVRLLARAIDVEPHDEQRALRLAALLASQGRSGSAASVLRQARGALATAGLPAGPELRRAERSLLETGKI